jgi:hypothetical protein
MCARQGVMNAVRLCNSGRRCFICHSLRVSLEMTINSQRKGEISMDMSIAAMSVDMNQARFSQQLGISVMKMAMNTTEEAVGEMLESLDPAVGNNIDIAV